MSGADLSSSSEEGDDPFPCIICFQTCRDPVTALCLTHNFCRSCLEDWVARSTAAGQQPTCPTCRVPIQRTVAEIKVNTGLKAEIERALAAVARRRARRAAAAEKRGLGLPDIPWADITVRAAIPACMPLFPPPSLPHYPFPLLFHPTSH